MSSGKKTKGLPDIATAIAYRGQLVMVKDGGIVTAYDTKTGKEIYQLRFRCSGCQQLYHVSSTMANERAKCRRCGHVFEIPASSAEALNGRRPGQAVDRLTACRIAGTGERPLCKRFSSRLMALSGCVLLLSAIVVAAAMLRADSSPGLRENLQRGRVARFSPPTQV